MARDYSTSKFQNRITELVYSLSLDGGPGEQAGDVSEMGSWAGLMRDGRSIVQALEADRETYGLEVADRPELEELKEAAGVILYENDQGFVESDVYDDGDKLEEAWEGIEKELEYSEPGAGEGEVDVPTDEYLGNGRRFQFHFSDSTQIFTAPEGYTLSEALVWIGRNYHSSCTHVHHVGGNTYRIDNRRRGVNRRSCVVHLVSEDERVRHTANAGATFGEVARRALDSREASDSVDITNALHRIIESPIASHEYRNDSTIRNELRRINNKGGPRVRDQVSELMLKTLFYA